ncbi:ATP-binding protein [Azospirillum rugosum]|uniref:Class 3 adenylate cyclase/tetratricopeptide (TPR) repeat protein n=1 Tax=Azospirillum rugosum TaxID=416170 RepID=A0ABS4SPR5_9PROT|nr:adenylate/guanylate cyclase domain-containing protein [Azospirillum rugosum]MBP2294530.1 class 3 adenylate cyclase/tetratricopeptide (TPR) repeat protein [Azospirillum rugosum]MDQ0529035.1 class 3 adenylate cyclase/tetratricopeptide (TPR) repeat protein [Azospirillum rugosum]
MPAHPEPEVADGGPDGAIRRKPPERKVVTVLFADIVESSSMVSGRDPEEADQTLLGILQILTDSVARYGGTIAQMLGDGMMAVFGAPAAMEDHALRACLAAQDIARAAIDSADFKVRVGISSGEVVAQVVESGVWTDYRTVGETVHVAAKLQQRAEPNSVLLSRGTVDLVPTGLTVRPAGTLRLAAAAEPVAAHALESVRAMRRTAMDMLSSDGNLFVGRQQELAELTEALHRAQEGEGAFILLSGEAGIGKSRLTSELTRTPAAQGFGTLYWPQFPIRRLGEPDDLEAVAQSLVRLVGGSAANGDSTALLAAAAERGGGELAGEAMRELLGVPSAHPIWQGLDPAQRVDFTIEGLAAALVDLSAAQPLLVLVEDAHWTRGLTTRLLDTLAGVAEDARLLILVTSRPSTPGGWKAPEQLRRIELEPLEALQVDEFLDHWLGHHPSLSELKGRLAAQSQGVPLYLEESLRSLETAGIIVGTPGHYQAGDTDAKLVLPTTIHGLLASRIDTLDPDARRTLMHAAVIGPSVDLDLLRLIAPVPSGELPSILARLEQGGFFAASRLLPNMEVMFRHALVQEVAYATLTKRERQPLHGRILHRLRNRRERELPGRIELMAHHAFYAEDWAAACVYGRRAGKRAEGSCKHADAGRYYGNALKALDHLPETRRNQQRRIDLWISIPLILLPQGGRSADNLLDKACSLAEVLGDRYRYARAASLMASFQWVYGDLDASVALCRAAMAALRDDEARDVRVQILLRLAGILMDQGNFRECHDAVSEAQKHLQPGDLQGRYGLTMVAATCAASCRARCLAEFAEHAEAERAARLAVDIADESGHGFSKAVANLYLGLVCLIGQRVESAVPPLKAALNIMEATRLHIFQPLALGALGSALVRTGQAQEGLPLLLASREHARMLRVSRQEPQILIWIADAALRTGNADQAVATAREAARLARTAGQLSDVAWASLVLSMAHAAQSQASPSIDALEEAESLAERLSLTALLAKCRAQRFLTAPAPRP